MAALKCLLPLLLFLVNSSFGYTTSRDAGRDKSDRSDRQYVVITEQPSTRQRSSGTQPKRGPSETDKDVKKGQPTTTNRGDMSEYKEWETPEFKVGSKPPPKGKQQQQAPSRGHSGERTPAKKQQYSKTSGTKQSPSGRRPNQSPESKSKSRQPSSQSVQSKEGAKSKQSGGKSPPPSSMRRMPPAKKGLLGGGGEGGGNKKREATTSEPASSHNGDIIKLDEEYKDLVNPVPSASFAEHFFTEIAKPMPISKGCDEKYEGELPKIIIPHHYDLAFKFDVKNMKFWGHELIYVEVTVSKLDHFILHSHELDIAEVLYIDSKDQKPVIGQITNVDPKEKLITVTLDTPLETKNGFISVKWKGTVKETLEGIYKTTAENVEDPSNPTKYEAISTQFEPISARGAFPCIDEPAAKATYNQTLITQAENVALANGLEENEETLPEDKEGVKWKKVTFGTTPKMSTFLVAFFAGDFEYIEGKSKNNGIRIRVYAAKGKKKDCEYALQEAIESLDFLEQHFEIDFPMPKIDLIAVPDYAQGAMENWGLITFRESMLLIKESEMSKPKMEICKMIITHELVHQWFGNLVTHRWWPFVWLKEGFAQYMQHFITDKLKPEWKVLDTFATSDYMSALSGDASSDSHAIEVKVDKAGDVGGMFDDVSYAKGASLLRWLMDWLGEETMKKGYMQYLSSHKFATACTTDLFDALESVSGKPVAKVMEAWVSKKGFPMISVMILNRNSSSLKLKMIQKRFSLTTVSIQDKEDIWSFPVKFITSREDDQNGGKGETTKSEFMFDKKSFEVTIPMDGPTSLDWVKINPGSIGFYIVKYLEPLSFRLVDPVMEQTLGYIDRVSLISEYFQQVMAGERSPIEYLNFLKAYRDDPNFYVWQVIDGQIAKLTLILSNTNFGDSFKVFCQYLYGSIYEKIPSWEPIQGEGSNESGLKALIIKRLGFSGYKPVVEKARQYYDDEMSGKKKMPKALKGVIFSIVTRRMDDSEVKGRIRQFVEKEENDPEKAKIQFSFVHVQDESQIKAVIKLSFSKYIRSMNSLDILGGLASTSLKARTLVWRFFVQNAAEFKKRYDGNTNLAKCMKGLLSGFASKSVLDKMKENMEQIVREHNIEGLDLAIKQGYDFGTSNYNLLLRGGQELSSFLQEFALLYKA